MEFMLECTDDEEPLRFDTELFISLLERTFELPYLTMEWEWRGYPLLQGLSYSGLDEICNSYLMGDEELGTLGSAYIPIMPVSISGTDTAKLGAVMNALCVYKNAPNPERAKEYLAFVATHPELCQKDLAFMLSPDEHDMRAEREDMIAFYRRHINDISFSAYALFGPSMYNDVVIALYPLDPSWYSKEEAVRAITENLNHISHIDILKRDGFIIKNSIVARLPERAHRPFTWPVGHRFISNAYVGFYHG